MLFLRSAEIRRYRITVSSWSKSRSAHTAPGHYRFDATVDPAAACRAVYLVWPHTITN